MNRNQSLLDKACVSFKAYITNMPSFNAIIFAAISLFGINQKVLADHYHEVNRAFAPAVPTTPMGGTTYVYFWAARSFGSTDCDGAGTTIRSHTHEFISGGNGYYKERGVAERKRYYRSASPNEECSISIINDSCYQEMMCDPENSIPEWTYTPNESEGGCDYENGSFWLDYNNELGYWEFPDLVTDTYSGTGWILRYTHPTYQPYLYYNQKDNTECCGVYNSIFGWSAFYRIEVIVDQGYTLGMALPNLPGVVGAGGINSPSPTTQGILGSKISAGRMHTLALKRNGTVWGWGDNSGYQIGINTPMTFSTPVQNTNISGVAAIAAGYTSSYALKTNGTVWSWGQNTYGELGDNSTTTRTTPVQITTLSNIVAIAAANQVGYALKSDGSVWAWGRNHHGQLGNGSTTDSSVPVQVSSLTDVIAIAAGNNYFAGAVKDDGTVWTWGNNSNGQLGNNSTNSSSTRVQAIGVTTAIGIEAGHSFMLVLKDDGSLLAWGANADGQLGDGSTTQRLTAVSVNTVSDAVGIAAGALYGLAVNSDGSVMAWGSNAKGQFGNGGTTSSNTPVTVSNFSGINSISAGYYQTVALKYDLTLRSTGENVFSQLGDGTSTDRTSPVTVSGLTL